MSESSDVKGGESVEGGGGVLEASTEPDVGVLEEARRLLSELDTDEHEFPFPDGRSVELARRLVAPGPKACGVSASECHEISEALLAAYSDGARPARARSILRSLVGELESEKKKYLRMQSGPQRDVRDCFESERAARSADLSELSEMTLGQLALRAADDLEGWVVSEGQHSSHEDDPSWKLASLLRAAVERDAVAVPGAVAVVSAIPVLSGVAMASLSRSGPWVIGRLEGSGDPLACRGRAVSALIDAGIHAEDGCLSVIAFRAWCSQVYRVADVLKSAGFVVEYGLLDFPPRLADWSFPGYVRSAESSSSSAGFYWVRLRERGQWTVAERRGSMDVLVVGSDDDISEEVVEWGPRVCLPGPASVDEATPISPGLRVHRRNVIGSASDGSALEVGARVRVVVDGDTVEGEVVTGASADVIFHDDGHVMVDVDQSSDPGFVNLVAVVRDVDCQVLPEIPGQDSGPAAPSSPARQGLSVEQRARLSVIVDRLRLAYDGQTVASIRAAIRAVDGATPLSDRHRSVLLGWCGRVMAHSYRWVGAGEFSQVVHDLVSLASAVL